MKDLLREQVARIGKAFASPKRLELQELLERWKSLAAPHMQKF